jgi:hypothetical protein
MKSKGLTPERLERIKQIITENKAINELTKDELLNLYSLAAREVQTPKEINQDEYAYKKHLGYWENLADKLRILCQEKGE